MKIASYEKCGVVEIGLVVENETRVAPLLENYLVKYGKACTHFQDMLSFLQGGEAARDIAAEVLESPATTLSLDEVRLCAPVPRPESIRDGMAFEQHIINCIRKVGLKKVAAVDEWIERRLGRAHSLAGRMNRAWYEQPVYYKGNRFSVIGPNAAVVRPHYTKQFDYELEWGVFIGRQGKNIPKERARDYIGGYTVFNDFSARDAQMREQSVRLGPSKGKDFDTGNAIGPWLVTPDEIGDPYNLTMTASVNKEQWSRGNTRDMYFTFEDMIAHISQSETLYPGEFIGSGTCSGPEGSGCGLELGKFLSPGDTVTLFVEKIGSLTNTVCDEN